MWERRLRRPESGDAGAMGVGTLDSWQVPEEAPCPMTLGEEGKKELANEYFFADRICMTLAVSISSGIHLFALAPRIALALGA